MADFNLSTDGEKLIKLSDGEEFTIVIDTRPWGRFEEILAGHQDESEELRKRRDELLALDAERRGVNLSDEIEKRVEPGDNPVVALARARLKLAVDWNIALLGSYELLKKRFARKLCKWGVAGHGGLIINSKDELEFEQTPETYEGIEYKVVSSATLDMYSRLGILEKIADEIYNALFPTEDEKKS